MSAQDPITPPEPVAPTPAPAPAPAPAAPAPPPVDPKDRRGQLAQAFEKHSGERGKHAQYQPRDNGKFAGAPQFPTPASGTPAVSTEAPAKPPAPVRPEMPKSLPLEMKAHWDTAPAELLARIIQRESDYEKGVVPLKEKARQADDLLKEFQPYELLLRTENVTPQQAIGPLLQTAAILRTGSPVQKAHAVAQTMRQYGISLEHVQQVLSGNAPPQPVQDPQVNQLTQRVDHLMQLQQQQEQARLEAEVLAFTKEPGHEHLETVTDEMTRELLVIRQMPDSANLSEREKLKMAYDAAIWKNEKTRNLLIADLRARELAEKQVAQAKNAAVQVSGAPSAGPAPPINPKDRRAVLEAAYNAHQNR